MEPKSRGEGRGRGRAQVQLQLAHLPLLLQVADPLLLKVRQDCRMLALPISPTAQGEVWWRLCSQSCPDKHSHGACFFLAGLSSLNRYERIKVGTDQLA